MAAQAMGYFYISSPTFSPSHKISSVSILASSSSSTLDDWSVPSGKLSRSKKVEFDGEELTADKAKSGGDGSEGAEEEDQLQTCSRMR